MNEAEMEDLRAQAAAGEEEITHDARVVAEDITVECESGFVYTTILVTHIPILVSPFYIAKILASQDLSKAYDTILMPDERLPYRSDAEEDFHGGNGGCVYINFVDHESAVKAAALFHGYRWKMRARKPTAELGKEYVVDPTKQGFGYVLLQQDFPRRDPGSGLSGPRHALRPVQEPAQEASANCAEEGAGEAAR